MTKKKGKIERSIHFFDIVLQRLGTGKESSFVNYENQSEKLLVVFKYFQDLNKKLKKESNKLKRLSILEKMEYCICVYYGKKCF